MAEAVERSYPLTIGDVARRSDLRASAIRFYERAGLLPKPVRASGQRRYEAAILDWIAVLERAKDCGFTLPEIRILFNDQGTHSVKWRRLATQKIAELDRMLQRIGDMKQLLERRCECATAAECGRCIREARMRGNKYSETPERTAPQDSGRRKAVKRNAVRQGF